MKNRDYWRSRFEQLEEIQLKKGLDYFNDLEREYKKASEALEQQIAGWYNRFAKNNKISFAEAKRLLNSSELKEFKWSVQDYIKYGKENAVNGLWMKQLENASAKVHISRLEALKLQMQQQVEVLYGNQLDGLDKTMRNIYTDGYYHTAYEIQRGFNVGYDLQKLNNWQLSAVISKPWTPDGKNFSDRIWQSKDQLVNTLHTELTQSIIRGDAPDKAIKTIAQKLNTSKNSAGRLVMTESAFFASAAQRDCFNDLDVERYEIVATLDGKTSPICQELDGKVFPMVDYQVGVTAPPFHCWCRTVTVPYFKDNAGSRAARDADGKTYYVPADMKYEEWKKTFVDGGSKDHLVLGDERLDKFRAEYEGWGGTNIQEFATKIVDAENLPLKVQMRRLQGANGQCQMRANTPEIEILTYELNSADVRSVEYQVKTAFHELFHAKANGLAHDIGELKFEEWAYADDVFAETTAHYLTKSVGVSKEIAPSYAGHLVQTLPKLKQLPEFSACKTIADFGEVAYRYRFGDTLNAKWKATIDFLKSSGYTVSEYSKSYIDYMLKNTSDIVDKLLENAPAYTEYKKFIIKDLDAAIDKMGKGQSLTRNEKFAFENALIISMNRLGVK